MPHRLEDVIEENHNYAEVISNGYSLPDEKPEPAEKIAVLTCMDARFDPATAMGLNRGDANFIRNAGGRASEDAVRSLAVSTKLLGTESIYVIHHTNCGMEAPSDEAIGSVFEHFSDPKFAWHTIQDPERAFVDDVKYIRAHPLIDPEIPIYALTYDVLTGELVPHAEAMVAGRPLSEQDRKQADHGVPASSVTERAEPKASDHFHR